MKKKNVSEKCDTFKCTNIHVMKVPEGKKKKERKNIKINDFEKLPKFIGKY